jgi:NTP pyrophosphatase (non-canonical NTP hydrolase)
MDAENLNQDFDLTALTQKVRQFNREREWGQFHNPKELAQALAIEASELMELFLWKQPQELDELIARKRDAIESELADVALYLIDLVDVLKVDLKSAIERKMDANARKYPVELARGKSLKYDELGPKAPAR